MWFDETSKLTNHDGGEVGLMELSMLTYPGEAKSLQATGLSENGDERVAQVIVKVTTYEEL